MLALIQNHFVTVAAAGVAPIASNFKLLWNAATICTRTCEWELGSTLVFALHRHIRTTMQSADTLCSPQATMDSMLQPVLI